jgi:hypothetical protein
MIIKMKNKLEFDEMRAHMNKCETVDQVVQMIVEDATKNLLNDGFSPLQIQAILREHFKHLAEHLKKTSNIFEVVVSKGATA